MPKKVYFISSTACKCIFFSGARGAKFCRFVPKRQRDHHSTWMWGTVYLERAVSRQGAKSEAKASPRVAHYVGVGLQLQLLQPDALVSRGGFSLRLNTYSASSRANLLLIVEQCLFCKVIFGTERFNGKEGGKLSNDSNSLIPVLTLKSKTKSSEAKPILSRHA